MILFLLIEIQRFAFYHPYHKAYLIHYYKREIELNARCRAFKFVEECHLRRLWGFKRNVLDLDVLHSKLMRVQDKLSQEDKELFEQDTTTRGERGLSIQGRNISAFDSAAKQEPSEDDKERAEQLAAKTLKQEPSIEFRIYEKVIKYSDYPPEQVLRYFRWKHLLIDKLNLYHRMHIGLYLAVNSQALSYLREQREKFFTQMFDESSQPLMTLQDEEQHPGGNGITPGDAEEKADSDKIDVGEIEHDHEDEDKDLAENIGKFAKREAESVDIVEELVRKYQEGYAAITRTKAERQPDFRRHSQTGKKRSWTAKLKISLMMSLVDKHLLFQMGTDEELLTETVIVTYSVATLLYLSLLSNADKLCCIFFVLFAIDNPSLLTAIYPLSMFLYALVENPIPKVGYWRFMIYYTLFIIIALFSYQLPIICGTPPFTFYSEATDYCQRLPTHALVTRIDFIIGIHKFYGPSSFGNGLLRGLFIPILLFFLLLMHKQYLQTSGIWDYVTLGGDPYHNPKFKSGERGLSQEERDDIKYQEEEQFYQEKEGIVAQPKEKIHGMWDEVKYYFFNIMPEYLKSIQPNSDVRSLEDRPYFRHNYRYIKPGKDLYNLSFFIMLIIFFYDLIFFSRIIGKTTDKIGESFSKQRFSVGLIYLIVIQLAWIILERVLYRLRSSGGKRDEQKGLFLDDGPSVRRRTIVGNQNAQHHLKDILAHRTQEIPEYITEKQAEMYRKHKSEKKKKRSPLARHIMLIKLILHYVSVFVVHVLIFVVLPLHTKVALFQNHYLVTLYIFCALYFMTSARQIRHGYPTAPHKQAFTSECTPVSYYIFRVYKAIPFLWELKTIVDWTCTTTALDLYQWFEIDDAYCLLYINKYQTLSRKIVPKYAKRPFYEKALMGCCFAFGIVLLIILPILIFSGLSPIVVPNPLTGAELDARIVIAENGTNFTQVIDSFSIYHERALNVHPVNETQYKELTKMYLPISMVLKQADMQMMSFRPFSARLWEITPPALANFGENLMKNTTEIRIEFTYSFFRNWPVNEKTAYGKHNIIISPDKARAFFEVLKSNDSLKANISIEHMMPVILGLQSTSQAFNIKFRSLSSNTPEILMQNGSIAFVKDDIYRYWMINTEMSNRFPMLKMEHKLDLLVYNEHAIGSAFAQIMSFSVFGLYATIVLAIGRFIRMIFDRIAERVIYEEIPQTDYLSELCEGIWIARLEGDLEKEHKLYTLLIGTIFRSPESMLKITGTEIKFEKKE